MISGVRPFLLAGLGLSVGLIIGWLLPLSLFQDITPSASKQIRVGEGRFTNPLLECEIAEGTIDAEKINFKDELGSFVSRLENQIKLTDVGIYFRDLNNGPTFGINQDDEFVPASLLKVPIMMAYFRAAETDPSILSRKMLYINPEAPQAEQTILPKERLVVGTEYSVQELIERMIIYSDNDSLLLLFRELPIEDHRHLYSLLGVDSDVITDPTAALSVKQYAAFFRILFNSSFLTQERSEEALEMLSRIEYSNGMRQGVPDSIAIAHKFGERQINAGERHLHDCGIVYYPEHPYLLCIMTRGPEAPTLERAITEISKFVFERIDEQYR